jgi:predicted methyltransferase
MKQLLTGLGSFFCLLGSYSTMADSHSDRWTEALQGAQRTPAYAARDVYRHPRPTLEFFNVTSTSTVVEIWPGGGWYTEILAPLLKDDGKFYAAHFNADSDIVYFKKSRASYNDKLAANAQVYGQVTVTDLMPPTYTVIAPAASVDVVVTFRNVHNWMKAGNESAILAAIYSALKPGGVLGIVEHRAKPGTDEETMIASGYVTEARVKEMAASAGFEFVAESEINANPKDSADYPKGVWTLPPSLRLGDEDRDRYIAIGESDRMTLKFVKPGE